VGARDDLDYTAGKRVSLPAYLTLDASGRILLASGPNGRAAYVTARIANALDEKYQAVQGFASPRRTVLIGAQVQR
jgi:outer membrane cobalamin receptor